MKLTNGTLNEYDSHVRKLQQVNNTQKVQWWLFESLFVENVLEKQSWPLYSECLE